MNLLTMSRREIEEAAPGLATGAPTACICIAYPSGRLHRVAPLGALQAVLHVRFSDCHADGAWCFPERKGETAAFPMTRGQALDVVDFVRLWEPRVKNLVVACYGGMSRSPGVACGLAELFGWDRREIIKHKLPNRHCWELILEVDSIPKKKEIR